MKINLIGAIIFIVLALVGCQKETTWEGIPVLSDASIQLEQKWQLVYATNQTPDNVKAFYETQMEQEGWANETTRTVLENNRKITIINYSRNKNEVEIAVSEDDGSTLVSVMIISVP